jgi:diaminohydroxyphosphoribosylaminopyrimidine deaminase/5-amino-6-(5-phosphoribosylamino)uracil reductase
MSTITNHVPLDEWALKRTSLPVIGEIVSVDHAMQIAFNIAWQGLGYTSPNPLVGAVALDAEQKFLGASYHARVGEAHAEASLVQLLRANGMEEKLRGGTIVVTLEPCAHHGRTPPCCDLLATLDLKRVCFAAEDPNPLVAGKGAQRIRDAGIKCDLLQGFSPLARQQNEMFFWRHEKDHDVFVGLKSATTIGGSIARRGDQRVWISGERSRRYGHFLRMVYDGIAVGAQTVIDDNPSLDPHMLKDWRPPHKVVLDPELRAAECRDLRECKLLKTDPTKVHWFITDDAENDHPDLVKRMQESGINLNIVASSWFEPQSVLDSIHQAGVHSLLLEGGAGLYSSFLDMGLVRRMHLFQSPKLYSGADLIHIETVRAQDGQTIDLQQLSLTILDSDILIEATCRQQE